MPYGNYAAQPARGLLFRRQGVLTGVSFKATENWIWPGFARYDLYAHEFDQSRITIGLSTIA
jgi:hypothetical protein